MTWPLRTHTIVVAATGAATVPSGPPTLAKTSCMRPGAAALIHHAATLLVMLAALRAGFVRVGAAVLFIHDATDLPIDATRLCQSLGWTRSLCA